MNSRYNSPPDLRSIFDQSVPGHYTTDDYVFFWSGPFSNWHPCTFYMPVDGAGIKMNCSEQAMMYIKAIMFKDYEAAEKIRRSKDPKKQKELGRAVRGYDEATWVRQRERISDQFLLRKFYQNENLKKILLDTGDRMIVEASPYDKIWGIGMGVNQYPDILDPKKWKGQNLLGESLMRVRAIIAENPYDMEFEIESVFMQEIHKAIDEDLVQQLLDIAEKIKSKE